MHLDPQAVAYPFEPFSQSMDVWKHYRDVFVVLSIAVAVVRLAASGCLSIVHVAFVIELVFLCPDPMLGSCKPVGLS